MSNETNIVKFPDAGTGTAGADGIAAEAAAWVVRLDRDDVPAAEREAFAAWVAQSDTHREAFELAQSAWGGLDILKTLESRKSAAFAQPTWLERAGFEMRGRVATLGGLAAAASVAVVLMAAPPSQQPVNEAPQVHRTVIGNQKTVTLSDGSSLLLNTDSEIQVRFTPDARSIDLVKGEVLFTVAKDAARPFSVYVDNRVVTAVGTAFAVHRRENGIEVTVTEGDVRLYVLAEPEASAQEQISVSQPAPVADLTAGENAVVSDTVEHVSVIPAAELNRKLAWRQGLLAFAGEPLPQVIAEVSRYTDVEIVISDPALEQLRFGGFLKVGNVDTLFNALEQSFSVKVDRTDPAKVYLSSAS